MLHVTLATAALAAAAATNALAAVNTYDDRATWEAATTSPLQVETFENDTLGDFVGMKTFSSGLEAGLFNGAVDSYVAAGTSSFGFENTTNPGRKYLAFGRHNINGTAQQGSYSVEFILGASTNAFGFDLSGLQTSNGAGGINVTAFDGIQIAEDFFFASDQEFTAAFYGFVSDQNFDRVRINIPVNIGSADYVAFDDVTFSIPTPGAATLAGIAALAATRRRR